MASYQYPSDAFNEAHNLINSLMDAYNSRQDMDAIRDVQELVEQTVSTAQQREHDVQDSIRGVCVREEVLLLGGGAAVSPCASRPGAVTIARLPPPTPPRARQPNNKQPTPTTTTTTRPRRARDGARGVGRILDRQVGARGARGAPDAAHRGRESEHGGARRRHQMSGF